MPASLNVTAEVQNGLWYQGTYGSFGGDKTITCGTKRWGIKDRAECREEGTGEKIRNVLEEQQKLSPKTLVRGDDSRERQRFPCLQR